MSKTKQEQTEKLLEELKSSMEKECPEHTFGEYDRKLDGLSEEEQKEILERDFTTVILSNGDDELISNCNSEYNLDDGDSVVSNGCVNLSVMLMDRDKRIGELGDGATFEYITCLRGGSFIIIGEPASSSREKNGYLLYANRNTLVKDYPIIMESLVIMKSHFSLIDEYIQKNGVHIVNDESYARGYV